MKKAWNGRAALEPQAGTTVVTVGASADPATEAVVFTTPFPDGVTVRVVVSQRSGSPHFYGAWATGISETGFTMHAEKTGTTGSTTITADWIAYIDTQ